MPESTVNIFILDKSSVAVASALLVNLTWKRCRSWLGVVKHGSSWRYSSVSQLISLGVVYQISWNLLDEIPVASTLRKQND